MRTVILVLICTLIFAIAAQAQVTPQSNAVYDYEKENTNKLYPGMALLSDLKPGETCYTNPWAFVESFPCSPKETKTLNAVAENLKGVIYINGKELKKNRNKTNAE